MEDKKVCTQCRKEAYCLPVGDNNSPICFDCFKAKTDKPVEDQKETIAELKETAIQAFAELVREHNVDIEKLNGNDASTKILKTIASILVKASLIGIHIRSINVGNIADGVGALAAEMSVNEFDEKFLPLVKKTLSRTAVSEAKDDLPEHLKAVLSAQGKAVIGNA